MQITIVAVMCHTLGAIIPQSVDTLADPLCREVIVIKDEMPMQSCMISQPALADWKERSIYRGDQWWISRVKMRAWRLCPQGARLRQSAPLLKASICGLTGGLP